MAASGQPLSPRLKPAPAHTRHALALALALAHRQLTGGEGAPLCGPRLSPLWLRTTAASSFSCPPVQPASQDAKPLRRWTAGSVATSRHPGRRGGWQPAASVAAGPRPWPRGGRQPAASVATGPRPWPPPPTRRPLKHPPTTRRLLPRPPPRPDPLPLAAPALLRRLLPCRPRRPDPSTHRPPSSCCSAI